MEGVTGCLVRSVLAAVLGMFYFGYNTGVVNAPAQAIKEFTAETHKSHYGVDLTEDQIDAIFTAITCTFLVGGMVGAMIGGWVADKLGRKRGLVISQAIGLLGAATMSLSKPLHAWEVLLAGRLIVGLTAGLNTVLCPTYVAEVAPVHLRGGLGVFNQLAVTSGIFTGQVLGLSEVLGNSSGWAWLLAVSCVVPLVQLGLLYPAPLSPRYLALSLGQEERAKQQLLKLRNGDTEAVERELREMQEEGKGASEEETLSVMALLRSSSLRKGLVICVVMHLSQQLSGMTAIFYYAVDFFQYAGIEEEDAKYANLGVGGIMVSMTLITIPLMDRLGRRILHLVGLGGMCICAVLIVVAQNLIENKGEESSRAVFLIAATLIFVVFFAVGPGSIPWMIVGEMFTQGPRPAASSISVFINWLANLAVGVLFPLLLIKQLGAFTFLPFAILLAFFFIFTFIYLPETKGRTVGEISSLLQK